MNNVINCKLSDSLIPAIASYIEEKYINSGRDLNKLAFVFGGRRPSLFLKRELSRRIKKPFIAPVFFTMDEFIKEIVYKHQVTPLVSNIESSFIIYKLAQSIAPEILNDRQSFAKFLPWAAEISGFIDHLDMEEVPRGLLENVRQNAVIGYDIPENINNLLKHIGLIRDSYHADLKNNKVCSRGLMYLTASKKINEAMFNEFDEILFCNFFYMHKSEENIIKFLHKQGKAVLFFQGDRRDWPVLDNISKSFSCDINPGRHSSHSDNFNLYTGFDTHSQASMVREIIKKIDKLDEGVLIVPDPEAVITLLPEISSAVDNFNVSLGYPLKRSSLYSLLEAVFKAQSTKRGDSYYSRDYLKAISHPLIKNIRLPYNPSITRVLVHKIEEILTGIIESPLTGNLFIVPDSLKDAEELYSSTEEILIKMDLHATETDLKSLIEELHELLFTIWQKVSTFKELSVTLKFFIEKLLKRSFITSYPVNAKAVESMYKIAEEFESASFGFEKFDSEDVFKILLERIGSEMISFPGSPLKGFQVLGVMEARSLNFENVIIMDMNESVIPMLRINEPLIPREVMLSLGLSRIDKEEEIQRYQFMRLIASAKNVHIVYCEDAKKEKSRFIEEIIWEKQKAAKSLNVIPSIRAKFNMKISDNKPSMPKNNEIIEYLKTIKYSATKLDCYLECPMKFYFRYVIGLREKEDIIDELEGAEIGTFIHDVLYASFKPFVGKKFVIDEAFTDLFFKGLDDSFNKVFLKRMKSDAFLVKEVINHRLKLFLQSEKERYIEKIECLEKTFTEIIEVSGNKFIFDARVDRIDILEGGNVLIIDYKTGTVKDSPKKLKSLQEIELNRESIKNTIVSFQLPLYIYIVKKQFKQQAVDAAVYDLRSVELKNYFGKLDDESKNIKIEAFVKALEYILNEICDESVPFAADNSSRENCLLCPYFYACRPE